MITADTIGTVITNSLVVVAVWRITRGAPRPVEAADLFWTAVFIIACLHGVLQQ